MECFYRNVGSGERALQAAPKVLDCLSGYIPTHILVSVVYLLMDVTLRRTRYKLRRFRTDCNCPSANRELRLRESGSSAHVSMSFEVDVSVSRDAMDLSFRVSDFELTSVLL